MSGKLCCLPQHAAPVSYHMTSMTWKTDQFNQEDIFTSVLWSLYVHNLSEKKWSEKNEMI